MATPKATKAEEARSKSPIISKAVDDVCMVLEEFRKLHPNITPNSMLAFISIATTPGITVKEVQKKLIVPSSSAVRAISLLATTHRGEEEGGLNLIRYDLDVRDRRVKHLYLKEKGERVWSTIKRILNVKEH